MEGRRRRSEFLDGLVETFVQPVEEQEQRGVRRQVCGQTFMCWMAQQIGLQKFEL